MFIIISIRNHILKWNSHFSEFLGALKFGIGDGNLQYYLYNFRAPAMSPQQTGLVLL